jgi:predicted MFS family arabinose efflux permease
MPIPVTTEYRCASRRKGGFNSLYSALLLLSLHWAVVLYINSSYLERFVSHQTISALYILGALFTILAFLYASRFLTKYGNVRLTIFFTIIEFCALLGMAFTNTPFVAVTLFVIHQAIVPLTLFGLDIFMEELIGGEETSTGGRRGLLLTIMSITGALASLGMGKLVGNGVPNFSLAYIASALILIPFLYIIIKHFRGFCDPEYPQLHIFSGIQSFWRFKDIRNVFFAHLLLQLFFTWMVIYTPVYLSTIIGFHWEHIGIILFMGLMAYVLLEYLIGYAADNYIGEKEMMAFGFAIIAIATSWFIFLDESSIIAWMIAMFMTRVGASFVEVTTESYFFKHTQGKDTNLISIFRITRPLSYVFGAILGSITMYLLPFELLFVVLGCLMLPGLFFAMALHDTR